MSSLKRSWNDFVVSSHLAFVPAVLVGLYRGVFDAVVLITVMVFLSVWYHREAEKNQFVARIELCSTCLLYMYGVAQCFHAPGRASSWSRSGFVDDEDCILECLRHPQTPSVTRRQRLTGTFLSPTYRTNHGLSAPPTRAVSA